MSDYIDNPPPRYAIRENDAAQVSQCTTNMLALEKLFHTLTLTVKDAFLNSPTEKVASDKIVKTAKHLEQVYSDYLGDIRLGLPDLQSYVLRYATFIIPMVLPDTKFTLEQQKAELDVFLKKPLSPVTAEPQELAPGVESIRVDSLMLLNQLVKDVDASIQNLNGQQEGKAVEKQRLDQELLKTPMTEKAKRDALKREITALKDQLEDIEIALGTAKGKKDKYSAAISTIPDTTNRISDALAKGPKMLQPVLTDVFRNVHSDASQIRKCLEDGSPIDKDALQKEASAYEKTAEALKKLAIG